MKTLFIPIFALAIVACSNPPETQTDTTEPVQSMENQDKAQNDNAKEQAPAHLIYVRMETSAGDVVIELDSTNAPQTVNNFLSYVDEGFYDGTIFHRVIDNFMIQGGGFNPGGSQKPTKDPIFLESQNGLTNDVGTVAMARTQSPNSATAQFFINLKDNDFLNYAPGNPGYAVFGKVASGMEVVNEIRKVKTGGFEQFRDWPLEDVVIKSIKRE